jgi:cardiolipin synthase A/B
MSPVEPAGVHNTARAGERLLAEQALARAAGTPVVSGNRVRILRDAAENYPAWLDAISAARRAIFFENYIIAGDEVGREFVAALTERARAGVRVRVLYDWMGALRVGSTRMWRPLIEAGGEVRCFNPPRLDSPFGWLSRDHRKMVAVDGEVGFVSGLCVSRKWVGDAPRGIEPWRDTGVEVRGPALADIEAAFAEVWSAAGPPLPADELTGPASLAPVGGMPVRVLATAPNTAGLYRLDQLVAALARRSLWLTDAYFVGMAAYVQALRAAAMDGVDVRLLVPGESDAPLVTQFSRSGYRPLLEAGIRVFEWNGPMLHAKTAVADGRWARVGSTNLNIASWLGNYELDIAVDDEAFARDMERMYEDDLERATEIVLVTRNRVRLAGGLRRRGRRRRRGASAGRAAAGALRIGNAVGAAMGSHYRVLGPAEAGLMSTVALILIGVAVMATVWPWVVAAPFILLAAWVALALLARARALRVAGRRRAHERQQGAPPSP